MPRALDVPLARTMPLAIMVRGRCAVEACPRSWSHAFLVGGRLVSALRVICSLEAPHAAPRGSAWQCDGARVYPANRRQASQDTSSPKFVDKSMRRICEKSKPRMHLSLQTPGACLVLFDWKHSGGAGGHIRYRKMITIGSARTVTVAPIGPAPKSEAAINGPLYKYP
jgi:hypothetical protein